MNMNINDHTLNLAGLITRTSLEDGHWKIFGFKSRPKRGRIFNKFVDKTVYAKERFVLKELTLLSTIDVIVAIKQKNMSEEDKLLYIIGVLSNLYLPLSQSNIFDNDDEFLTFIGNGVETYSRETFLKSCISRVKDSFDEKSAKNLMVGCSIAGALNIQGNGLILDRNIIAQEIYPTTGIGEKLNFPLKISKLEIYSNFAQKMIGNVSAKPTSTMKITILGVELDDVNFPILYKWAKTNPATLAAQLQALAKIPGGTLQNAAQNLEVDLQHES
jgi:hypothetical protein